MSTSLDGLGAILPPPITYICIAEVKPSRFGCGPRYRSNVTDGIGHRIINQRDVAILKGWCRHRCFHRLCK